MVDTGTFNQLSANDQNEYQRYSSRFIYSVLKSDSIDGFDFKRKYKIQEKEGVFFLAKSKTDPPFAGIESVSKAVIEALLCNAVQNYGR